MPKIIQLQQHIADLIAAGEVVSRPASVVKELVENSIDAGAGIITVEIASGGMSSIRITDNGCGIEKDDVKTAFLRHATSKLSDAKGLERIETLGFRGEALAAIAAVSRIEVITRIDNSDEGVRMTLEGGTEGVFEPTGCPAGTTIIVRDLFFNTPARLKFMKTDRAEGAAVSSIMLRCALSRPDISFRYIKDGKTEFHTPGDSKPESCIYTLLGRDTGLNYLPVNHSYDNITVKGYISRPGLARGNRNNQFFYVNARTVRSVLLQSALEQAYRNILMSGRFPACVLYIETSAGSVDVNVHPAKTEVRFISDKQIFDAVYYATLGTLEANREANMPSSENFEAKEETATYPAAKNIIKQNTDNRYSQQNINTYRQPKIAQKKNSYPQYKPEAQQLAVEESASIYKYPMPSYKVIGEALNTYIIAEKDESIWIIDKHAVHERIHFNAYQSGTYEPMSESLLTPVICRVGAQEAQLLLDNAGFLCALGFEIESFSEDSVAVRYIPSDIHQRDVEPFLSEICVQLERGGAMIPANIDKIHKSLACSAAIKAGDISDIQELEALTQRVLSGEITHCPHGRPVAFELTGNALEKGFGRI